VIQLWSNDEYLISTILNYIDLIRDLWHYSFFSELPNTFCQYF